MFFLIIVDPWDADSAEQVIGPFNTENDASAAWEELKLLGSNPDAFGGILPLTDMSQARTDPPYCMPEDDED